MKLFCIAHGASLAGGSFLDGIGQQPYCRPVGCRTHRQAGGLLHGYLEFCHIIHVVGSHDGLNGPLLALGIDDYGMVRIPEGGKAADSLSVLSDKESVGTA